MNPYTGAVVLVNVDAAHNGGNPYAPALVTRCEGDELVNVRVLYDGIPSHLHPQGHHRPEFLPGIRFHDTSDLAQAASQGLYGAFWPPGSLLITIIENQEKIMSGLTDLQAANTAQSAAITAMQAEWTTFLADVQAALANADSDAAVEAAAQLVTQQTAAITAQTAAMTAADPANTPAPAPVTPPAS